MNLLFSCIGKRGYIADFFRPYLGPEDRIIGTSNTKWTTGFEHCDKNYILPDINSPSYISAVKEICQLESISAILSFFDPDVVTLSNHFDEFLSLGICPIIPRMEIAEICFDKIKTYHFLIESGFKTASTYWDYQFAKEDLNLGKLTFPVFVKPRFGFGSQLTFLAHNDLELDAFFHYAPDMIIQEVLTGQPINFDILNDINGNVLSVIPWIKFRSRLGETEQSQTINDEKIINFGVRLGKTLRHIGPLDADLYYNGEEISILEINLRFGGGYPLSHLAGANFPLKIIKMINGEKLIPDIGIFQKDIIMMKDNLIIGGKQPEYFEKQSTIWKRDIKE